MCLNRQRLAAMLVLLAALATGCATSSSYSFPLTGDPLIDGPTAISNGPPQDRVLWQYRTGAAAMERGLDDLAASHFDDALDRVEGALGPDREARRARRYFRTEAAKTFLGEPYERVMAYYYRGILFWKENDLGNARACFRSALLQDADTLEHTYASDYALLEYLEGLASLKLNDDPSSASRRAQENARLNPLPPYQPQANVLFFVEYGEGPVKYATGQYQEELRFRPGVSPVRSARIRVQGQTLQAPPYDDLYFQATTRGGRVMDHILANKAVFKSGTSAVGDAALISGAVMAGGRDTGEVGLGLLAFGLLAKGISASTTPQADTRTWGGLPLYLSFAALPLAPGQYSATVEFLNTDNQILGQLTKVIQFQVPDARGDTVLHVSDQSPTSQTL